MSVVRSYYFPKLKMACEKCHKKIPYLVSYHNGTKFKCPKCDKWVNFNKCVIKIARVMEWQT